MWRQLQKWVTFILILLAGPIWAAPPVALPDAYAAFVNTALEIPAPGLIANDFGPKGDTFIASQFIPPTNGTLALLLTDGSFT